MNINHYLVPSLIASLLSGLSLVIISLVVLLAIRYPIFPKGREIFRRQHEYLFDKHAWRPSPFWVINCSAALTDHPNNYIFYIGQVTGWNGPRRFRRWNQIKNRYEWTLDRREGSPTLGKSALTAEVSANFNAVLAGDPNPPAIHWVTRFTGL